MADPYLNYDYVTEIDGFTRAGFMKVGGLKSATTVVPYREGGENDRMRQLMGQTTYDPVVLERGVTQSEDLPAWYRQVHNPTNDDGTSGAGRSGARKTVTIFQRDPGAVNQWKITLVRAWPSELSYGDLDAAGNDVWVETMTLVHEGMTVEFVGEA